MDKSEIAEILVTGLICTGFAVLLYKSGSNLAKVMRGDLSSLPKPPLRLTYKIPQAYWKYRDASEGWKGELFFFSYILMAAVIVWLVIALYTHRLSNFAPFWIVLLAFGTVAFLVRIFQASYDGSITFCEHGVRNRSRGRTTPYHDYAKVSVEQVVFGEHRFQVVTLIPKKKTLIPSPEERYGFGSDEDIAPLLALLEKNGLEVKRIEGASSRVMG